MMKSHEAAGGYQLIVGNDSALRVDLGQAIIQIGGFSIRFSLCSHPSRDILDSCSHALAPLSFLSILAIVTQIDCAAIGGKDQNLIESRDCLPSDVLGGAQSADLKGT